MPTHSICLADAVADVVISINGLHVVPDARRFLAEISRILKPDGRLWLITPVTAQTYEAG